MLVFTSSKQDLAGLVVIQNIYAMYCDVWPGVALYSKGAVKSDVYDVYYGCYKNK